MANTYTQLFVQLIFVVENRQSLIINEIKDQIYGYMTGIINNRNNKLYIINGLPDHLHILLSLNPEESISKLVQEVKRHTTNYINENKLVNGKFSWQKGYAAFSYSKSSISNVINYIKNQESHHKTKTFNEEYLELLRKFEIEFDEKYIFKEIE